MRMKRKKIDKILLLLTLALSGFGILMVHSSSFYFSITSLSKSSYANYFSASVTYFIIACIVMFLAYITPLKLIKRMAIVVFIVTLILLISLKFIGIENKGATRWISIGRSITIQPSEIMKISIILFMSYFASIKEYKNSIRDFFILLLMVLIIAMMVFYFSKDLSSSFLILCLGIVGICAMGYSVFPFLIIGTTLGFVISSYVLKNVDKESMRMRRVKAFMDMIVDKSYSFNPDNYQQMYSIYSIAEGKLIGKGLGAGIIKTRLPEPYSDFIFAVICEELGFLAAIIILVVIFIIVYRMFKIAMNSKDNFSFVFATMSAFMIASQTILNIFVVTGLCPVTGVTLPFLSRGGTSLLMVMVSVGVCLNIDLNNKINKEVEKQKNKINREFYLN